MLKTQSYTTPLTTCADSYTISGNALASQESKDRSVYYMVNRTSPMKAWPEVAKDDRMVFWGLSHYILDNLTRRITDKDVLDTKMFMDQAHSFGGALPYDWRMMKRVVDEYDGYLPLLIEALPEGDVFYPHQPMVQVTALDKGFGELAAHVEACLLGEVSISTARATLTGHLWQYLYDKALFYKVDPKIVDDWVHDFGMRAGFKDESMCLGLAHLLFFNGTDTFNAAFKAWRDGVTTAGKSILALAHRIVQGYINESDCYEHAYNADRCCSQVADCYNFERAVSRDLVRLAAQRKNIVIARPDSGDALHNDDFVQNCAVNEGLYVYGPKIEGLGTKHGTPDLNDRYIEPTYLCSIEGNSVKPQLINELLEARYKKGFHPFKWGIVGIGGYLRNNLTRDSLSSKWALNACGLNNRPVMKFSEEKNKETLPGPIEMYDGKCNISVAGVHHRSFFEKIPSGVSQTLVPYYCAGKIADFVGNFKHVHERAKQTWIKSPQFKNKEEIVEGLNSTIQMLYQRYK